MRDLKRLERLEAAGRRRKGDQLVIVYKGRPEQMTPPGYVAPTEEAVEAHRQAGGQVLQIEYVADWRASRQEVTK